MIFSKNTSDIIKESFLNAFLKNKPLIPAEQMFPYIVKFKDFDKDLTKFIEKLRENQDNPCCITEIVKKDKKTIKMIGMLMAGILENLGGTIDLRRGLSLQKEDWKKLAKGLGCSIYIIEDSTRKIAPQRYGEKNLFTKPIKIFLFNDSLVALYGRRYGKELIKGNLLM